MSFSGREYKAQQRRISDSSRRIKLKALFQKEKDRLRAEQRRERRQKREEENSTAHTAQHSTHSTAQHTQHSKAHT
jgi:hypothetical protein